MKHRQGRKIAKKMIAILMAAYFGLIPLTGTVYGENGAAPYTGTDTAAVDPAAQSDEGAAFYTVDYYYGEAEYRQPGRKSLLLSRLFAELGIDRSAEEVQSLSFTDPSLLEIRKDGRDYVLTGTKAFDTEETLSVVFADGEIVITVKDNIAGGSLDQGYYWISDDGVLNIRALNNASGPAYLTRERLGPESWPWHEYRDDIVEVRFIKGRPEAGGEGYGLAFGGYNIVSNYMFAGCENLKKVSFDGLEDMNANGLARMFSGCTSLTEVNFNVNGLYIDWIHNMQNAFNGCTALTKVTFPAPNEDAENPVPKSNAPVLMAGMFDGCTSLTEVNFNGMDFSNTSTMTNMFRNCSALETLDLSFMGKLRSVTNMDGLVEGCTGLKTLILDELDNSVIGVTNANHGDYFGRNLGIDTCTALETLSAKNSNIWMCRNNAGNPGSEYFDASSAQNLYYFTQKQMIFVSNAGRSVEISTIRNYIDLITDRDGTNMPQIPDAYVFPDRETNINIVNGDLNPNGAGHLAPGVYTMLEDPLGDGAIDVPETYYSITDLENSTIKVFVDGDELAMGDDITTDDEQLVVVNKADNTVYVSTANRAWAVAGEETIDCDISLVFEDAAIDVNGKLHDVQVDISKVTFTNLDRIPQESPPGRQHDSNNYVEGREYYRPILQATPGDGLTFKNYARLGDPTINSVDGQLLTQGAGTEVTFTVSIPEANGGTSFVFYADDIDVPESQGWQMDLSDACLDSLSIQNVKYGIGGEGFILGKGNDLSSVTFADATGLLLVKNNENNENNMVIATGSDPSTSWSAFAVKANAKDGATYTWTSGISCTSYVLRNTPKKTLGSIEIMPKVNKVLQNGILGAGEFSFELKAVRTSPADAPAPAGGPGAGGKVVSNAANGDAVFPTIAWRTTDDSALIDAAQEYYPGTSPVNNNHGKGAHNTFEYEFTVREVIHTLRDPDLIYDESEHTIKIKISTPENDAEMKKGIKAEIYLDGANVPDATVWTEDASDPVLVSTFTNTREIISVAVQKVWDDANNQDGIRPKVIEVTLQGTYEVDGEVRDVTIETPTVTIRPNGGVWPSHTWQSLPKSQKGQPVTYTVVEKTVDGYSTEYDKPVGITGSSGTIEITNKHIPEVTTITVNKSWDDKNDQDGLRSRVNASVYLYKRIGMSYYSTVVQRADNPKPVGTEDGWSYTWADLPKYVNGEEIHYFVEERIDGSRDYRIYPDGRRINIESGGSGTFINTHTPQEMRIAVTKVWDDNENQDGVRPPQVTIRLWADSVEVDSVELPKSNGSWKHLFTGVPKYKNVEGTVTEIDYTVTEDEILPYQTTVTKTDEQGS